MSIPTVLVVGNPNSGKTTLFNSLTGSRAKVGNYPGVTVDRRTARAALGGVLSCDLVDVPGTYSLTARSREEQVAIDALLADGAAADAVLIVADMTTLRRGLYFATQALETGLPSVIALTMADEAKKQQLQVDCERLGKQLGCEVVPVVARTGEGRDQLRAALGRALREKNIPVPQVLLPDNVEALVQQVAAHSGARGAAGETDPVAVTNASPKARTRALWALLSLSGDASDDPEDADAPTASAELRAAVHEAHASANAEQIDIDRVLIEARYAAIDALLDACLVTVPSAKSRSARVDDVLVHPLWGMVAFALVMAAVFQTLFSWSEPFVSVLEDLVGATQGLIRTSLPAGAFTSLLSEGVVAGVGNVIVFVPQIALLFVFLTILEDSGYLARVAFVIDRVMGGVGLHGKAFVPMLSGFACAIPAVMATRTIESKRDRLLTMLVVPIMSCSARLPVYVLLTATVFDANAKVIGPLGLGALVLLSMYATSVGFAVLSAFVLRRTVLKGPKPSLVLELPPYRLPTLRNIALATGSRVRAFLTDAGTVILALTIVLWGLLNYPKDEAGLQAIEVQRAEAAEIVDEAARKERESELESAESALTLKQSAAGRLGRAVEPVLAPLGMDWRLGVGVIGAFAAREVFVSTLGIVFDVGGEATEESEPLRERLKSAKKADGSPLLTPLSGIALMIFFVLACQCMSTLAVVRREAGSWKWAMFLFGYMSVLAYGVTLLVYQGGRLLGLG